VEDVDPREKGRIRAVVGRGESALLLRDSNQQAKGLQLGADRDFLVPDLDDVDAAAECRPEEEFEPVGVQPLDGILLGIGGQELLQVAAEVETGARGVVRGGPPEPQTLTGNPATSVGPGAVNS
jgi:hypothetical protein